MRTLAAVSRAERRRSASPAHYASVSGALADAAQAYGDTSLASAPPATTEYTDASVALHRSPYEDACTPMRAGGTYDDASMALMRGGGAYDDAAVARRRHDPTYELITTKPEAIAFVEELSGLDDDDDDDESENESLPPLVSRGGSRVIVAGKHYDRVSDPLTK